MPLTTQSTVTIESEQSVVVTKEIGSIIIIPDDKIYWQVRTIYNGETKNTEYYCCQYLDFAKNPMEDAIQSGAETWEEIIERLLWGKVSEIDAMPTSTPDEIREKARWYGHAFKLHIN